jgi:SPP1 family predicted phage head-tail adaptor
MQAGKLRHRVTFQRRTAAQDTIGEREHEWIDVMPVWAWLRPATGREIIASGGPLNEAPHRVTTRFYAAIDDVKLRIKFGDRIFNIHSKSNFEERGIFVEFLAMETTRSDMVADLP